MKMNYNYQKFSRITDETTVRRQIISDLSGHNEHLTEDIPVDAMMNMDVFDLHALIEQRKLTLRMNYAAVKI